MRGLKYRDAKVQEEAYRLFLSRYETGRLTDTTWELAAILYANLRKSGATPDDTDIIIGAFCIENGYTLVTTNTKHFTNMDNIQLLDWTL